MDEPCPRKARQPGHQRHHSVEEVVVGIRNRSAPAGIRTRLPSLEAPTAPCPVTTTSPEVALARSTATSVWTTVTLVLYVVGRPWTKGPWETHRCRDRRGRWADGSEALRETLRRGLILRPSALCCGVGPGVAQHAPIRTNGKHAATATVVPSGGAAGVLRRRVVQFDMGPPSADSASGNRHRHARRSIGGTDVSLRLLVGRAPRSGLVSPHLFPSLFLFLFLSPFPSPLGHCPDASPSRVLVV